MTCFNIFSYMYLWTLNNLTYNSMNSILRNGVWRQNIRFVSSFMKTRSKGQNEIKKTWDFGWQHKATQTPTKGVITSDHRFYLLKFKRNGWTRPKCFFNNFLYYLLASVYILVLICSVHCLLDCDDPMGMGNGKIPNSALKAASVVWLIHFQTCGHKVI